MMSNIFETAQQTIKYVESYPNWSTFNYLFNRRSANCDRDFFNLLIVLHDNALEKKFLKDFNEALIVNADNHNSAQATMEKLLVDLWFRAEKKLEQSEMRIDEETQQQTAVIKPLKQQPYRDVKIAISRYARSKDLNLKFEQVCRDEDKTFQRYQPIRRAEIDNGQLSRVRHVSPEEWEQKFAGDNHNETEKASDRGIKGKLLWAAIIVAAIVCIGEGFIAADIYAETSPTVFGTIWPSLVLPIDQAILPIGIPAMLLNFVLFRSGNYEVAKKLFLQKYRSQNDAISWPAFWLSLSSGLCLGFLSFHSNVDSWTSLSFVTSAVVPFISAIVAGMTVVATLCLLYFDMANVWRDMTSWDKISAGWKKFWTLDDPRNPRFYLTLTGRIVKKIAVLSLTAIAVVTTGFFYAHSFATIFGVSGLAALVGGGLSVLASIGNTPFYHAKIDKFLTFMLNFTGGVGLYLFSAEFRQRFNQNMLSVFNAMNNQDGSKNQIKTNLNRIRTVGFTMLCVCLIPNTLGQAFIGYEKSALDGFNWLSPIQNVPTALAQGLTALGNGMVSLQANLMASKQETVDQVKMTPVKAIGSSVPSTRGELVTNSSKQPPLTLMYQTASVPQMSETMTKTVTQGESAITGLSRRRAAAQF